MEKKIKRVLIAAPSLHGCENYSAEYSFIIKSALVKLGYETFLLTNSSFKFDNHEIDSNTIIPTFPFNDINIKIAPIKLNFKYNLLLIPYYIVNFLSLLLKNIFNISLLKKKSFLIFKNNIDILLHKLLHIIVNLFKNYIFIVLTKFRDIFAPPIIAYFLKPLKLLKLIIRSLPCFKPPHCLSWVLSLNSLPNYYSLVQLLHKMNFSNEDLLFVHTITQYSFNMWALVANRFATNKEKGELVFLFRESPQKFNMNSLKTKISIKLYENSFLKGSLRCSTDSLRLAKDYAKVLAVPLDIYPIPYITKTTSILKHFFNEQSVINCLILDNTNSDKNFSIIYQLIKEINSNIDTIKKFNFSLQAYNMNDDASLTHLNNMTFPNVSFYERTLSSEKYYQLIDEADVIFVPHQDHSDSSCTSRRALEAIANGKIIISHQNCWLADECIRFGAAAELVPDGDIQAVINALLKILSKINSLKSQAASASIKIRKNHNCEVFVKKLLYGPIKHSINIGDIITISYPFSNLINGKSGNSTRVNYLMRLLKDYKLSILAPDQVISSNPMEKPPFKLYNYSENKIYLFDLWYIFLEKFFKFFGDKKDLYLLNIFNRHTWNRNFSLALTQALHGSSAIFVEYPFQTKLISIYAKAMRIPLIVTAHDQLSLIVKNKLRRNYIDKKEIESLSCADLAFTVSQNEHEYFKNIGINNILAPSTTDIHYFNFSKESKYRSIELIRTNFGCDFKVFFLFVGGNQEPNREASIYLRKIARQAHENNLKWNFVVAGSCAEPKDSTDNYIALGQVDDTMLKSLYETCYAIVSPLLSGTGASVKTVEAMGAGKIILGTQKTFRGLSVTDGVECFIENDVSNYINRLKHIVVSSDQKIVLQSMSKKAKQFAEKYDYHICLKDYKLFIQNWPLE